MKLLAPFLAKGHELLIIKAHVVSGRLLVAVEVFDHGTDTAVTAILAVELSSLVTEVVHETKGSSVDYHHRDGWHGLLQRDAVIEVGDSKPLVTRAKLGKQGTLSALTRAGGKTLVCGTKMSGRYAIDGFIARVESRGLVMLAETSRLAQGHLGNFHALHAGPSGTLHAGGAAMSEDHQYQLFSGLKKFAVIPASAGEICAIHERGDGVVLIAGRDAATMVKAPRPRRCPMRRAGCVVWSSFAAPSTGRVTTTIG